MRRECCSFSNGEYVKAGLAELEHWIYDATEEVLINIGKTAKQENHFVYYPCKFIVNGSLEFGRKTNSDSCLFVQYAGSSWDELKYIRQAVGFLVSFALF